MGEEAEVPVWEEVQRPCRSVVITFLSPCLRKIFYLSENCCKNILLRVKNIFMVHLILNQYEMNNWKYTRND